jgi:hypothetical protein
MSDPKYFAYWQHMNAVAQEDVRFLKEKDKTYGGSWKKSGGRSAWFMLKRKIDRLIVLMTPPDPPPGWPTSVHVNAATTDRLLRMTQAEDIFAQITTRPGGEDGTVLAEVRDLRRYLLLVEAEMLARGVVEMPLRPGTPEDGGHHASGSEEGDPE